MRVDIQPQWKKLANWYWNNGSGMSIWEMLSHDYSAMLVHTKQGTGEKRLIVDFPDEKTYTAFLLRWS